MLRKRRGIDPSRTVAVSIDDSATPDTLLANISTAEILLHHLRTRTKSVDPSVAAALLGPATDPYLKLYAAAGTLAMPGPVMQRLATAVRQDPGHETEGWAEAASLFRELQLFGDWADVVCLGWRLKEHFSAEELPLATPPMLEICWRWASAHSARYQDRQTLEPTVAQTASRAEPDASPWFAASAAPAATSAPSKETQTASKELVEQALVILTKNILMAFSPSGSVEAAVAQKARTGLDPPPSIDISKLSSSSERLIHAIIGSGAADQSLSPAAILPQLAASMASPIDTLGSTIRGAVDELSSLLETYRSSKVDIWNSDPHKGQFGRKPTCKGATLSLASFEQTDGIEFLALQLEVRVGPRGAPLTGPVTFHLHPTFSPNMQLVAPLGGVASFTCYAWGGFTVGVETSDGRRMELDLAELDVLPMWFRTR